MFKNRRWLGAGQCIYVVQAKKESWRPDFDRSIMMDFQGAKLSPDFGFILMREFEQRYGVIRQMVDGLENARSASHTQYSIIQMFRQRVH